MRLSAAALTCVVAFTLPTAAVANCSEPGSEPFCLDDDDSFRSEDEFESCRWEVENFVEEVTDFAECQQEEQEAKLSEIENLRQQIDEIEQEKTEQIERANEVVERFNCRAESGAACY
ncbi:hypothetical protein L0V05_07870 [Tabrizicola sp. J26]|uniref:hypothetical protein n=1 Tax=Alitabrizicola rongguiensis TaxID=2909234 RepID=UPI001F2A9499|nr:hypothetical protein [Tabrizicola rongguiensis]MCF1708729.1 hypothetical protein [Tabrizicola rongguiensis]